MRHMFLFLLYTTIDMSVTSMEESAGFEPTLQPMINHSTTLNDSPLKYCILIGREEVKNG